MVCSFTFDNISVIYRGAVFRFIGGGNQRKPLMCHKSLTNYHISSTPLLSRIQTYNV